MQAIPAEGDGVCLPSEIADKVEHWHICALYWWKRDSNVSHTLGIYRCVHSQGDEERAQPHAVECASDRHPGGFCFNHAVLWVCSMLGALCKFISLFCMIGSKSMELFFSPIERLFFPRLIEEHFFSAPYLTSRGLLPMILGDMVKMQASVKLFYLALLCPNNTSTECNVI